MNRPNLLYLHSHDTGRYVQPYGHAVPTPHLQALAEEGVLFRQCFCAAPTCSASRAALLTGRYPHACGMTGLAHRGWALHDCDQHLVRFLRRAGYHTALFGEQHEAGDPRVIGYDQAAPGGSAAERTAGAVGFLSGDPPRPFFLSVGYLETHRRFHPAGLSEDPRYCRPPAPLPDTPETRKDMADFRASARVLDAGYGLVLAALDRSGLASDTLVLCTTDHGPAFPAMKCNLTDHGIGVLLILRGPGGFTGGRVVDSMVSHVDLFPSLCEVLGLEPPPWLQGRSVLPLIRGQAGSVRDAAFAEVTYHAAPEPQRCVRTARHKYIRRYDQRQAAVLPNCDDSPSKDLWVAHGWREQPRSQECLFDLVFDPNEAHDLSADPRQRTTLASLRDRLETWMAETGDPLLTGSVPVPPGARLNDPDGLSPSEPPRSAP